MLDSGMRELRVALDRRRSGAAMMIMTSRQQASATMRLANISRSGMFIEADPQHAKVTEGSALHFCLQLDHSDEDVTGVGLVRWVRGDHANAYKPAGFGLQVVEFHDQTERRYLEFLETCLLELKITDLMDPQVPSVTAAASIADVLRLMAERPAGFVVVSDGYGGPLGTFSHADFPRLAFDPGFLSAAVGHYMTPNPLTLSADSATEEAYAVMRNGTSTHIPVVDDGMVIGLLATRDLVRYWAEYMELQSRRLARNYERAMSMIAHDLRTPIALIQMTNAMLTSGEVTTAEYLGSGFPEIVGDRCDMMMSLIDDILDVHRIKAGLVRLRPEVVDTERLLRKIIRAFSPAAAAKKIAIKLQVVGAVAKIKADPLRLEQVFNNLISNGLKFSPEGQCIDISVETQHSQVAIVIADHGPGIAPGELHQLFQEYAAISTRSTKGEKRTGLGLAITKRLVEAHGGRISVRTSPGAGSTFTVLLPIDALQ